MIIQVKADDSPRRYIYNAINNIRVGDLVELPGNSGIGAHTWVGEVTAVGTLAHARLMRSGYAGPIKAIVGRAPYAGPIKDIVGRAPLKVTVEANTRSALRQKLLDAIDGLDEELIERGNR